MSKENILAKHRVERVLAEAADNVETRQAAFFDDPDDPETMHKFRVSIRTLRSLCRFIAPWQDKKQNRAVDRALRDAVRETSRLRELDVLEEQIASMEPAPAPDLLSACSKAAREERQRVRAVFSRKETQRLLSIGRRGTRAIAWRDGIAVEGLPADCVAERFQELLEAQDDRYGNLDRADAERTHMVRKRAKEVRYAAVKFAGLLPPSAADAAEHMKDVQDELGALCDARVNVALLSSLPTDGLSIRAHINITEALAQNYARIEAALDKEGHVAAESPADSTTEADGDPPTQGERDEQ